MTVTRTVEGRLLPLVIRGLLLVAGTAVAAALVGMGALGPAIALLVVIAFAAIPLPSRNARLVQAFAEAAALGLVIGSIGQLGPVFLPLLLVPVFLAGRLGGVTLGATSGAVGFLGWVLGVLSSPPDAVSTLPERLSNPFTWLLPLVAVGAVAGWIRRLTLENESHSDTAYEQAFHLLSQLQEVARDLSLGLDPVTLATALLDETGHVGGGSRVVSVVTGDDRLVPLVRNGGDPGDDTTMAAAWRTGQVQRARDRDGSSYAFPIRMGERVVAVLGVIGPTLDEDASSRLEAAVSATGPKLAAALLFDDVRRLATVDERLRLAREIHDGIAQEIASLGYLLDDMVGKVPSEHAAELADLREHVRRVVSDLRLSIFDLRSGSDDGIGLGTALSEHVQRVGQQSDLVVHTVLDEYGDRLTPAVEVELLRIAQEAVTNVRKHARASNLWVECTVEAPRAWVRIADDGVGLQPAGPQSMGLRGMRERARRIGGELVVGERHGGGTVVEVTVGDWGDEKGAAS